MKFFLLILTIIAFNTSVVGITYAEPTDPAATIAAHNKHRNLLNTGVLGTQPQPNPFVPDLIWDAGLAQNASDWSEGCYWGHTPSRSYNGSYFGENLAANTGSNGSIEDSVQRWVNEHTDYNYSSNSSTGVTGHYTQVVWGNTTRVGCGVAYCPSIEGLSWGGQIFTCQYQPGGNYGGTRPYSVNDKVVTEVDYSTKTKVLTVTNVKVGNVFYRVKFKRVSLDPWIMRVVAYDKVDTFADMNWMTYPTILQDNGGMIVRHLTIDKGSQYFDAGFRLVKDLDFQLEWAE